MDNKIKIIIFKLIIKLPAIKLAGNKARVKLNKL